jgi:hypothetical protein
MMPRSMGDRASEPLPLYRFTVTTTRGPTQDDIATLLHRVADALEEIGAVDVHDITFHVDYDEDGPWPSMTVYYERDEDAAVEAAPAIVIDAREEREPTNEIVLDEREPEPEPEPAATASTMTATVFAVDRSRDTAIPVETTAVARPAPAPAAAPGTTAFPRRLQVHDERQPGWYRLKELLRSNRRRPGL